MSFSLTTEAVKRRTKFVTRRLGWLALKRNDLVQAIVQGQGLPKGAHVEPLAVLRVTDVRREPLRRLVDDYRYGQAEVVREGFPGVTPAWFLNEFLRTHRGTTPESLITRIAFTYEETPS